MYAAFPRSKYHAPSDFSHAAPASLLLRLFAGSPYLENARDIPRSHACLRCYATLSDPEDAPGFMSIAMASGIATCRFSSLAAVLTLQHCGAQSLHPCGLRLGTSRDYA